MRYLLPTLVSLPHVSVETLDVWSEEAVVLARETARKLLMRPHAGSHRLRNGR